MIAFGSYTSPPIYDGMTVQALYLTMRDGVRLAADLHLPANLPADHRLPTIVSATRYWRKQDLRPGFGWMGAGLEKAMGFFVSRGYAVLLVDVRGTGASFGTRRHEWDKEEVKDGWDIAAWIAAQPWSNGCVGGYGTSYSGTTAELLSVPNHPAVKAVLPRFNEFDVYTDIAFPGGLYLRGFVETWGQNNAELDANRLPLARAKGVEKWLARLGVRGVKPVDRALLKVAVREHAANNQADFLSNGMECRDDAEPTTGVKSDDFNVYAYRPQIEASGAAIYGWGGWFDAGTADAVIRRFLTFSNPQVAVVGAWNHGAGQHASPYDPHGENVPQHWHEALRFFDYTLKGQPTGIEADIAARTLFYFTIGEEAWKSTTTFPPPGVTAERWYLAADHGLSRQPPTAETGADEYTVDFEATTGKTNRWYTQAGGGAVLYSDRAEQDKRLLTYTSAPLNADTEITGYPVVTLYTASTAEDGAFFVYLEDVAPDGTVYYLTEGMLRAIHRKISTDPPPYVQRVPYHSFKRKDAQPLVPGQVAEISFGLLPISALIRKNHRIRIAIAGADDGLFPRIPASGTPTITLQRSRVYASYIDLPVLR